MPTERSRAGFLYEASFIERARIWWHVRRLNRSRSERARYDAACTLSAIGDASAVEPLIKAARSSSSLRVRIASVLALRNIGDERAIEPLVKLLEGDTSESHDYRILDALAEFGMPAAAPLVELARTTEDKHLRREISNVLEKINRIAKWKPHDFGIRDTAVIPKPEVPPEFQRLVLKDVPKAKIA